MARANDGQCLLDWHSLLTSGIGSTGDWLQLSAASAWLLANIAAIVTADAD